MKRILISIILISSLFTGRSQDKKLEEIISSLKNYYQYHPAEKVFLTTNKEVFKPGETVWFNALVKLYSSPNYTNLTPTLTVRLLACEGTSLLSDDYKIEDGRSAGDFVLPGGLESGKYFVAAFTDVARDAKDVFLKMIIVEPMDEGKIQVEPVMVPGLLKAGKANKLNYKLVGIDGETGSERVKYELYAHEKLIEEGKNKTEKDGTLMIQLNLPDQAYDYPLRLTIEDNGGHLNYEAIFHTDSEKLKLKFFAEGGNFVAGVPLKIGYIVTNSVDQLLDITGDVLDSNGNRIAQSQTLVPGYGLIPFMAESSKKYTFYVTSELGNGQTFELPAFKDDGAVVSLQKVDDDFMYVGIVFSDKGQHQVYALVSRGDQVFWATELEVNGGIRVKIPKDNFQHGVSLLSVFSKDGGLLAERTLFVDKNDLLNVEVKLSDEQIKKGQTASIKIDLTDANGVQVDGKVSASVSVDNENLSGVNELVSYYLVNSELEHSLPVFTLMEKGSSFESSVNYLMVLNQFRNFDWDGVFDFSPEDVGKEEEGIKGHVFDKNNNPVQNAKVSLVNRNNMQMLTKPTDEKGSFFFSGLDPEKINEYVVKAIDEGGREDLTIEFEKSFNRKLIDQVKTMAYRLSEVEQIHISKSYFENNRELFGKIKKPVNGQKNEPAYKAYLETATSLMDVIKMIKPYDLMGDKIVFKGGMNSFNAQDGALIVIDGQQLGTSASALASFSPGDVESINVSTNAMDIQKYTGLNSVGVIEIKTKRGEYRETAEVENTTQYKDGHRVPNDFMTTRADNEDKFSTTLYWTPEAKIDASTGFALEIPTSEVVGDFLIEVEAIDKFGRIGKASKIIRVTN